MFEDLVVLVVFLLVPGSRCPRCRSRRRRLRGLLLLFLVAPPLLVRPLFPARVEFDGAGERVADALDLPVGYAADDEVEARLGDDVLEAEGEGDGAAGGEAGAAQGHLPPLEGLDGVRDGQPAVEQGGEGADAVEGVQGQRGGGGDVVGHGGVEQELAREVSEQRAALARLLIRRRLRLRLCPWLRNGSGGHPELHGEPQGEGEHGTARGDAELAGHHPNERVQGLGRRAAQRRPHDHRRLLELALAGEAGRRGSCGLAFFGARLGSGFRRGVRGRRSFDPPPHVDADHALPAPVSGLQRLAEGDHDPFLFPAPPFAPGRGGN